MDPTEFGSSAILAVMLVPLVSLLKRRRWTSKVTHVISMLASLIAAIGGALIDGKIKNTTELLAGFGTAFAVSQVIYVQYFKESTLNEKLTGI